MKLEYGKRYRSRSGQETTPLFKTPEPAPGGQTFSGYFIDELGGPDETRRTWSPDGLTATRPGFDRDLVEEVDYELALRNVLDYVENDERKDYESNPRSGHIYESVKVLRGMLEKFDLIPKRG
jgi:hypothetical protein